MKIELLNKPYDYESTIDIEGDIFDAMDEFEDSDVPRDKHGYIKGKFRVIVEWCDDNE